MPFSPERCKPDVLDRFWSKVDRSGECWTWTGYRKPKGYGQFAVHTGATMEAHRFIDYVMNGPHEPGECTLHKCDNRACVRPSHLWRGTNYDNVQDMIQKNRARKAIGERAPRTKLTPDQVRAVVRKYEQGATITNLSREFCVARQSIMGILSGKNWSHVTGITRKARP